ncbi:hypothetical protein M413DRAFT_13316 [Hebeloma cylindrosporum]|uniref:F-box domain-containing protein n=1 Tax=Hebeloma cylindrosporum TaxID=76867 RepID=A0A0C2Y9F3_HEBCY|nr:hypothetical protein M413DRAFT_13316 [Hebeloma cylindrosporum h7]
MSHHVVNNNAQIQGGVPFTVLHQDLHSSPPYTVLFARNGWTEQLLERFGPQLGIPPDQVHLTVVRDRCFHAHVFQNDQGIKISAALLPFDALTANPSSRNTLLSLPNLYMIQFCSPINPQPFFNNVDQYMVDIVSLLRSFSTLRHVVLPLDLAGQTTSVLASLRRHPWLTTLDLRLPEGYVANSDDIFLFRLLVAAELSRFDQIQTLVIQSEFVSDWVVITHLASLEGLEELRIISQDNQGVDGFVTSFLNLTNGPLVNGFTRLETLDVDLNNTSAWAADRLRVIFPNVNIL